MLCDLREKWQSGLEARHIEELVGNVFADFAPYAGADSSRLTFTLQHGMEAACSLAVEEDNNVSVHCAHVNAANILFDSSGVLQPTVALRLPLCQVNERSSNSDNNILDYNHNDQIYSRSSVECPFNNNNNNNNNTRANVTNTYRQGQKEYFLRDENHCLCLNLNQYDSPDLNSPAPLRYVSFPRGAQLLYGLLPTTAGERYLPDTFGQFEFTATLPVIWQNKVSYGMRVGSGAFRLTHHQHTLPGAQPPSASNEVSLSTNNNNNNNNNNNKAHSVMQHTLDLSWTFPFAGKPACTSRNKGNTSERTNLAIAPWVCTVGFQHPEPFGDTLIAFALQNDRVTSSHAALPSRRVIGDRNTVALPLYATVHSPEWDTKSQKSRIKNNDAETNGLIASDDVESLQVAQEMTSQRAHSNTATTATRREHEPCTTASSSSSLQSTKSQIQKGKSAENVQERTKTSTPLVRAQTSSSTSPATSLLSKKTETVQLKPTLNHDGKLLVEGDDVETLQAVEEDASLIAAEAKRLNTQSSLISSAKETLTSLYHKAVGTIDENVLSNFREINSDKSHNNNNHNRDNNNSNSNNNNNKKIVVNRNNKSGVNDEYEGKLLVEGDDVESLQAMQQGLANVKRSRQSMLRNAYLDKYKTRFGIPFYSFKAVVVQTLHSRSVLTNPHFLNRADATNSDLTDDLTGALQKHYRVVSSDKAWNQLPTLIGCNVGFAEDLIKVNAAAILHDGSADVELSTVFDITPVSKSIPTLVKVGWNNTGRVAVGITSLIGEVMSMTLGIHHTRNERLRFGLEVKI